MKFTEFIFFEVKRSEFPKPKTQQDLVTHLNNVDQLIDQHRFDEGLAYISGLLDQVSKGRDWRVFGYLKLTQGVAYRKKALLKEDAAELVKACAALEEALNTFKESDWECGPVQLNLGAAFRSLAQYQERDSNNAKAVDYFEKAKASLEKAWPTWSKNKGSQEYPLILIYLGSVYNCLAGFKEPERNWELAVKYSEEALANLNKEKASSSYALLQFQLGHAFGSLADSNDSAADYQKAINSYQAALQVYNLQSSPVEYSHTLNSLANVYIDLARLEGEETNLNQAMEICKEVLNALTSATEYPLGYAFILHNLGSACKLYSKIRNRDWYLDKALHYFESILQIETLSPDSEIFASTYLNLGIIHNIAAGLREREQHLTEAIDQFQKALRIYDSTQNQLRYAITLNNLGHTYYTLAETKSGTENLGKAMAAFEEAAELYNPSENRIESIEARLDLGRVRLKLARFSFDEGLIRKAVQDYEAALKICNSEEMPVEYGRIQIGLGEAYQYQGLAGRIPDSFQKAIEALELALQVYTAHNSRPEQAEVMKKLGSAYQDFAKAYSKEINLQKAMKYYQDAQEILDLENHPLDFGGINEEIAEVLVERAGINQKEHYLNLAVKALEETAPILAVVGGIDRNGRLQRRLGDLYRDLAEEAEDKESVYRKGIAAYESALQYFTSDQFPREFADTTLQIGITYKTMAETIKNYAFGTIGEYNEFRADRLLNAMGAFQGALAIFTLNNFPYDYAAVQFNIGETYALLAELQERNDNLAKALAALEEALKVYTPNQYPAEHKKAIYRYEKVKQRM